MKNKVVLCSIDGMRPDGLLNCGSSHLEELFSMATYTLNAQTVSPSITLPCHMSMFYGVEPSRHGIVSNVFVPQVHNVKGLFEKIYEAGGRNAFYYGWHPLRDIAKPETVHICNYEWNYDFESADTYFTDVARNDIKTKNLDFVFLYQVDTDVKGGHDNGWMTDEYLKRIKIAIDNVYSLIKEFGNEYTFIITADHGGHDRMHGADIPEDMTIPMLYIGKDFEKGKKFSGGSILDIPKTVASVMGFEPEREWEGNIVK